MKHYHIDIIRIYHQNSLSVRATFRALREFYDQHHRPTEGTIRRIVRKGRGRTRPQIGPLTFLKIFVLEMIYSGRSQHTEPYAILYYWG